MGRPRYTKLTNSSDETDVSRLLSGDIVFSIPYFQRPYKWKPERLRQLQSDILQIVDGMSDTHFLGAIIIHGRRSNPSDPTVYDVIDGQQRLTTLFLLMLASIKVLSRHKHYDDAIGLFQKYGVIGRTVNLQSNIKLHPSKDDRAQLNDIFRDLVSNNDLKSRLGSFQPTLLPSSGENVGILSRNYKLATRFLEDQYKQGGLERLLDISRAMLDSVSVVQIDVYDPTNGPKIFDSLNSRQEPMTVGDLIRNDIFSKISGNSSSQIEQIDRDYWQPFYRGFQADGKNLFDSYFFPYGLTINPNLSKSEVYPSLKKRCRKSTIRR